MSHIRNTLWWLCFTVCAIALQTALPGLDALSVGLVILLQERDYKNMLWLLPLFILLQEGMGTRPFGAVIVWYAAIFAFFRLGRWLLEMHSFIFVFLLSACLGAAYFAVAWLMAPLQNLPFNVQDSVDNSLIQALFLSFAWQILAAVRHWNQHVSKN